jgi:hypothetical protein
MKFTYTLGLLAASAALSAQTLTILGGAPPVPVPGGLTHEVTVQNTGAAPIPGPIAILVNKLDARAYVENRTAIVRSPLGGLAYLMLLDAGPDNTLSPGETARTTVRTRAVNPNDPLSIQLFTSSQGPYQLTSVQYPYKVSQQNGNTTLLKSTPQGDVALNVFYGPIADGDFTAVTSHNQNSGEWKIRTEATTLSLPAFANPSQFSDPVIANFNGGSNGDLALFNKATGQWAIRNASTGALIIKEMPGYPYFAPPSSILHLVPADYDLDGLADLATFNQTTARFTYISSRNGSVRSATVGIPGSSVPAGSHRTDSSASFFTFDRATRTLFTFSTGASISNYDDDQIFPTPLNLAFEADDDQVVSGDLDGDGFSDTLIYSLSQKRLTLRDGATDQTSYTGLELLPASQLLGGQHSFSWWCHTMTANFGLTEAVTLQLGQLNPGITLQAAFASTTANASERIVTQTTRVR